MEHMGHVHTTFCPKKCQGFWTKKKADELQIAVDAVFNKAGAAERFTEMSFGKRIQLGVSNIFLFSSLFGEDEPILTSIFFKF